jgi:hypothetical protein
MEKNFAISPEQQRIKIAEACPGIKFFEGENAWCWFDGRKWTRCKDNDPLNDLNAAHEMEKGILKNSAVRWDDYTDKLTDLTGLDFEVHATAAQRSQAFLMTLGLWKD